MDLMKFKDNVKKINEKVWQSKFSPVTLNYRDIEDLENHAKKNNLRQFRYCLQTNNKDNLQQMLIFHSYPQVINWHCQPIGGMVFYYVIKGQVDVILQQEETKIYKLADYKYPNKEYNSMISIPKNVYRRISTNSNSSIFLEISSGSFKDSDTVWKISMKK